jgi:hypothetical protein
MFIIALNVSVGTTPPGVVASRKNVPQADPSFATPPGLFTQYCMMSASVLITACGTDPFVFPGTVWFAVPEGTLVSNRTLSESESAFENAWLNPAATHVNAVPVPVQAPVVALFFAGAPIYTFWFPAELASTVVNPSRAYAAATVETSLIEMLILACDEAVAKFEQLPSAATSTTLLFVIDEPFETSPPVEVR